MKRTAITRKTAMPRRTSGLCHQSRKARREKAAQKKAYQAAGGDAEQCWCSCCGVAGEVERSHLYTQKQHPEYRNDERNWLVVGKHCNCHSCWENNKPLFARLYPAAYAESLRRMEELDPKAYQLFLLKNPAAGLSTI